jgi:DNA-binding protein HU-beta
MNKTELINSYATTTIQEVNVSKPQVEELMNIIKNTLLSGEEITLPALGKLKVSTRPGRNGRNPSTGESIVIESKRVVKFHPSSEFEAEISALPT